MLFIRTITIIFCFVNIIILFIFNYIDINYSRNCISLIIPSTEQYFLKCYKQFFHFSDTLSQAKEIIIVISSVTNITNINNIVRNISINKKIILGIRYSNHNAASNRNYGFMLSKCKFISYFDIDDIMSINRLPFLYDLLKNDLTTEFVLHKFSPTCNKLLDIINPSYYMYKYNLSYNYIYNSYYLNYNKEESHHQWCCKYIKELKKDLISNGWATMRRYIMNKIKYNISYSAGEDSDFNSRVILNGYNTSILNISLGYYRKGNTCINYAMCK